MPLATCPDCGTPRNSDTCYPNKKSGDGLQRFCRDCDNARRRKNYTPLRRGRPVCTKCANQDHRVEGKTCSACGRKYAPLGPVRADAERRGASAWAMAITEA